MTKTIYNYHQDTGEFTSISQADESPLEPSVALIPAFATEIEPPAIEIHETPVFIDTTWTKKPDWRGVALFSTVDGLPVSIGELGKTPSDVCATEVPMPSPAHSWENNAWILDQSKIEAQLTTFKETSIAKARVLRQQVFYTLAGMQSEALSNSDLPTAKAISSTQSALRGLPDIDLSACKTEADVNVAFAAAWRDIITSAPDSIKTAFKEVLA